MQTSDLSAVLYRSAKDGAIRRSSSGGVNSHILCSPGAVILFMSLAEPGSLVPRPPPPYLSPPSLHPFSVSISPITSCLSPSPSLFPLSSLLSFLTSPSQTFSRQYCAALPLIMHALLSCKVTQHACRLETTMEWVTGGPPSGGSNAG